MDGNLGRVHFSTAEMPVAERVPYWREQFARGFLGVDLEPRNETLFRGEATLIQLPGMRVLSFLSSPARMARGRAMIAAGDDHFGFALNTNRKSAVLEQRGRHVELRPGDAVSISHLDPADFDCSGGRHIGLVFPIKALEPLVGDVEAMAARLFQREHPVLRLLKPYLAAALRDDLATPELARLAADHVRDLVAMVIGTTEEGAHAIRGSYRVARLHGIKADVLALLGSPDLSVGAIARRQGLTPRHVHRLFEAEGTTFSRFVLGERLARAYRSLADPRYRRHTITAIALAAGFGDLSHFNRSFRSRYGVTPSEVRSQAYR